MKLEGVLRIFKDQSSSNKIESVKKRDMEGESIGMIYVMTRDTAPTIIARSRCSHSPARLFNGSNQHIRSATCTKLQPTGVNLRRFEPRWMAMHCILVCFEWRGCGLPRTAPIEKRFKIPATARTVTNRQSRKLANMPNNNISVWMLAWKMKALN